MYGANYVKLKLPPGRQFLVLRRERGDQLCVRTLEGADVFSKSPVIQQVQARCITVVPHRLADRFARRSHCQVLARHGGGEAAGPHAVASRSRRPHRFVF